MREDSAAEAVSADGSAPDPTDTHTSELRRLTVLFCDLVGSTALSERLDPEDLREVVREYQAVSSEVIESWEGHIAQYLGDGLLVYFGYPRAHKDDPLRAVHAALGIVEALRTLNERLERERGIRLAVRLGIHTGPVVVGKVGGGSTEVRLALGETPNVAAGLEGVARPDGVAVSAATFRYVDDVYPCEALGPQSLKGISVPVEVYRVDAAAPAIRPAAELRGEEGGGTDAERRLLTVMFCDLVGAHTLSAQLPPTRFRELVLAYQETASAVIGRYGGHVAQYLGDGLMVYFGYPSADEDDPQNAVHAGLGILEAMAELNQRLEREQDLRLAVRMGIHTGRVVAGEVGAGSTRERLAVGQTPNVAARVQSLAEPETVVISASTHRYVRGVFDFESLGVRGLKGVSEPMAVYRALGAGAVDDRFEVAVRTRGLVPLVGRQGELDLLGDRFEQVDRGRGQVVLLSGEAGIGKSRLRHQFRQQTLSGRPHVWLTGQCSSYHQNSAFYPLMRWLGEFFELRQEDSPERKLGRMEAALTARGFPPAQTVPLFADLFSIPLGAGFEPLGLSPQLQKQKTLEAMFAVLARLAQEQPVVLAVEDLHWVDPSTLEFLDLLVDRVRDVPIFALLTYRPSFEPPWGSPPHLLRVTLERLAAEQVEAIVLAVTDGVRLPPEVLREVVEKTDGVPIFVEELTKTVIESGQLRRVNGHYELAGRLASLTIPSTLQGSLTARLDRLPSGKEVAQLGAAIGREFHYDLMEMVAPLDEAKLREGLGHLVAAEMLFQRGDPPAARYVFKHALIQDAAYRLLLKSTRKRYHERIARALSDGFPETAATQPALLAHHYTEAGLNEQAIDFWLKAGELGVSRSANVEAIDHLHKGLGLIETLPASSERDRKELALQTSLGGAVMTAKGFGAREVRQAYRRAQALCRELGDTPELLSVLRGLWLFHVVRGNHQTAVEVARRQIPLAEALKDPVHLLTAHFNVAGAHQKIGNLVAAREHLEQAKALDKVDRDRPFPIPGEDPGVNVLAQSGPVSWLLGYPDRALRYAREAIALSRRIAHPFSLAPSLLFAAWVHLYRREPEPMIALARESIAISEERGFWWVALGNFLLGRAMVENARVAGAGPASGRVEDGLGRLRGGLDAFRFAGARIDVSCMLGTLADTYLLLDRIDDARSVLDEAFAVVEETGERYWEIELHRLRGVLALRGGGADAERTAETAFRRALEVARGQESRSLELRASVSLGRLWRRQGRGEAARDLVAAIYGWFREGFDTADLRAAKTLLDELGD